MRYAHLLSGEPDLNAEESSEEFPQKASSDLENRVIKLETELEELKAAFDKLMKELMG